MDELIPDRVKYIALALLGVAAIGGAYLLGEESSPPPAPANVQSAKPASEPAPLPSQTAEAVPEDEEDPLASPSPGASAAPSGAASAAPSQSPEEQP